MISHVTEKSFLKSTSVWSHGLRCFSISLLTSLLLCPPSYKATTPFCNQVVNLQALPSEETDPALALLCPVRALRIYVDRTRREGCLQTEAGPLDSGCRRLGVPISRRAVPPGGKGSLHQECCLLSCVGARYLSGRHLQSCGLGNTEHLRKILQSLC